MKKSEIIYFTREEYKILLNKGRILLKGRKGLSCKKKRVRKKILNEIICKIVEDYILEHKGSGECIK